MNLREVQEELEKETLSEFATKSIFSKGRERVENQCDIRTDFQRDRDRIIHCKAFRRLKHKTQVFIAPINDHYRTRLTHTLEVAQIARTLARALRLNEDLVEAIALGHDLGHTPFGHAGENALNKLSKNGFEHSEQSLRVVERIEKSGKGLNLTWEVRDGILNHRTRNKPQTLEGEIVRLSDKIAYINHDIDDAIRAGLLKESDIPLEFVKVVGKTSSTRIDTMIRDTITNSQGVNEIKTSSEVAWAMKGLRSFMFKNVYADERTETEDKKVERIIKGSYNYFLDNPDEMEEEFQVLIKTGDPLERVVCDYVACMTDTYIIDVYKKNFIPSSWNIH